MILENTGLKAWNSMMFFSYWIKCMTGRRYLNLQFLILHVGTYTFSHSLNSATLKHVSFHPTAPLAHTSVF
jgi:hypothetical protein